jgi:hypothetical protein
MVVEFARIQILLNITRIRLNPCEFSYKNDISAIQLNSFQFRYSEVGRVKKPGSFCWLFRQFGGFKAALFMRAVAEGPVFRCPTTAQSNRLFPAEVKRIPVMVGQRDRSGY